MSNIGDAGIGATGIGSIGIGGLGLEKPSGVTPVTCADLAFTEVTTTNSSAVLAGQTFTVTNGGGGPGSYITASTTSWQSSSDTVSFEVKFKSNTGSLTVSDVLGILLYQGDTGFVGVGALPAVGTVYDFVGASAVETGVTMTVDEYTLGLTLNQSTGAATYTDSEGNSGSLTVTGYDNSLYTELRPIINTSASNVLVGEYHTSPNTFTLGLSGGWCSYTTSNEIANYAFTSDYKDIHGYTATFGGADPSIGANGIALGATTDAEIPTTFYPVNDFRMTLRIEGFATNPSSASIFNKGGSALFYLFRESGEIYLGKDGVSTAFFRIGTGAIADVTSATGYTFLIEQTAANGLRFKVDEIGGSTIVDTTDSSTAGKDDITAWASTVDVGHRASLKVIEFNLADWVVEPI